MDKRVKMMGAAGVALAGVLAYAGHLVADPRGFGWFDSGYCPEHLPRRLMYDPGCRREPPLGGPMVDAYHPPRHMPHKPGFAMSDHHRRPDMLREFARLDLSREQREQIERLQHEKRKAMHEQRRGQREAHQVLHEAMIAQPYDAEAVHRLAEAQGAAVTAGIIAKAETRQKLRALLTDEQREQLDNRRPAQRCTDEVE